MNVLIISATEMEVSIFKQHIEVSTPENVSIALLVTGVGSIATTYALTRELQNNKYDLIIQAGVGGSFDCDIPLGEVVFVTSDQYGDLGAEDHDEYIDIFDMGLMEGDTHPHTANKL